MKANYATAMQRRQWMREAAKRYKTLWFAFSFDSLSLSLAHLCLFLFLSFLLKFVFTHLFFILFFSDLHEKDKAEYMVRYQALCDYQVSHSLKISAMSSYSPPLGSADVFHPRSGLPCREESRGVQHTHEADARAAGEGQSIGGSAVCL